MLGPNGVAAYRQKQATYQSLRKEIDILQRENNCDAQRIKALGDKNNREAIEREAREQLGYARPGEMIFVEPASPPLPGSLPKKEPCD